MAEHGDNDVKKYTPPELLAPCGSPEALDAALLGGADAVYLGTKILNARMNARNFDGDALRSGIAKAHRAGVRVYITMNTAVTDRQMHEALTSAHDLCKMGADALIVADLGFASMLRKYLPGLPIHASTQCSAHSLDGVKFLAERGFSRVVIARELSKVNIEYIVKNSPVPIEIFVHGAMCVSASGQCLLSSFIGGRSGNRGECAQPCRMQYNGSYPLSLKDMCLAGHITEITASGAASLKIEGRMKSPEYVYNVTSVYRRLLDQRRNAGEKEMKLLEASFSRGGFSDGYYTGKLSGMNGVRSESDKAAARDLRTVMRPCVRKLPPITVVERESIPFTAEEINKKEKAPDFAPVRSARWYRPEMMCGGEFFGINYIPLDAFEKYRANGVLLPPVIPDSELDLVKKKLERAKSKGAIHAMIANIGQIKLAKELGFAVHGDYRLNIFSNATAEVFSDLEDIILSPELIIPQMRDIAAKKGVIVYGRMPLMTLEKPVGAKVLTDRTGAKFQILSEGGRDILLNSVPTYTADMKTKMKAIGKYSEHFIFTAEDRGQALDIIDRYKKGAPSDGAIKRIK